MYILVLVQGMASSSVHIMPALPSTSYVVSTVLHPKLDDPWPLGAQAPWSVSDLYARVCDDIQYAGVGKEVPPMATRAYLNNNNTTFNLILTFVCFDSYLGPFTPLAST